MLFHKTYLRIRELLSITNLIFSTDPKKNFLAIFNITNIESELATQEDYAKAQLLIDTYHPELNMLYQKYVDGAKYLIETDFDLDKLIKLPKNTLGYQYANWLIVSKFDQSYYKDILDLEVKTIFDFLRVRYIKVHDIAHALLGVGNSVEEEFYLTSIGMANAFNPASFIVFMTAFVRVGLTRNLFKLKQMWEVIIYGYVQGQQSKSLLAVEWENYFEKDVLEIKKELKLPIHINLLALKDKTYYE